MLETIARGVKDHLARHRRRPFLEAAMAASALVAMADGKVTFSEASRVDDIASHLTMLKVFDIHVALNLFQDYVGALQEDTATGREAALVAITRGASDPAELRTLLVRLCVSISQADGVFHAEERDCIVDICHALHLRPEELDLV